MQTKVLSCMPTKTLQTPQLIEDIEQSGVVIVREMQRFFDYNEDFVFPHIILTLILRGSARAKYDMQVGALSAHLTLAIFPLYLLILLAMMAASHAVLCRQTGS